MPTGKSRRASSTPYPRGYRDSARGRGWVWVFESGDYLFSSGGEGRVSSGCDLDSWYSSFIIIDTRYTCTNTLMYRWLASCHVLLCCVWDLRYEQRFSLWKGCQMSLTDIDPTKIVADSITNNQPIIFVSINYRLNIFSFGDGNEKNLALKDQRLGIDWVRRNIASFGGDPVSFS